MSAARESFYEKLDFGFEILEEIINRSVLDDEKRLNEILSEGKSKSQMKLMGSGHTAAVARATSYFSDTSYYQRYDRRDRILYSSWRTCAKNFETKKERDH
ncbi:MAG: hypothetical protein ACLUAR_15695 [Pilosibacter sp.]